MLAQLRFLHIASRTLAPVSQTQVQSHTSIQRARCISSTAPLNFSQRERYVAKLREDWGTGYENRKIPTQALLDALRDMQAERHLNNKADNGPFALWRKEAAFYRDARRAISQLVPVSGGAESKPELTIGEIEKVLSDDNGISWTLIRELGEHGKVQKLAELNEEMQAAILFNRIHGIGEKLARRFAREGGCRTLDDLLISEKVDGRKITDTMKLSMTYLEELEVMITCEEIEQFKDVIAKALKDEDEGFKFEIMGSYRRGEAISSDIDVVVWHESFQKRKDHSNGLMDRVSVALFNANILDPNKILSGDGEDPRKLIALTRLSVTENNPKPLHRQIDIRLCPVECLPYMLLGNTGDDQLMKLLRKPGWTLNEYGMGEKSDDKTNNWPKEGTEIFVKDESEIFDHLELPYLEPKQRSYSIYSKLWDRKLL